MLENIALIKEVIELMPTQEAQSLAKEELSKINLSHLGAYRVGQCSSLEIFYIMFIRAMMTKDTHILIDMPYTIIDNLENINEVIDNIQLLKYEDKKIFVLDTVNHESRYGNLDNLDL